MACRATLGRRSDGQGVELMLLAMNGPGRACSVWRSGSSDSFGAVLRSEGAYRDMHSTGYRVHGPRSTKSVA